MYAEYEALIYDLDGTLVHLDVDWEAARRDVVTAVREHGHEVTDETLWELFDGAADDGVESLVHETLEAHERRGARRSTRLPDADDFPHPVPVGVCSLNAESACRIALERHDLDAHVDVVVGRDTVEGQKPDPGPLLHVVQQFDVSPADALFIGDSHSDEQAANRADVDFRAVE